MTPYVPWTFDQLWNKAAIYAARAHEENRESELFPFWSMLTLEILARAVLAHEHPSLLANSADDVMTACGLGAQKSPRSIPSNVVFQRCAVVVADFTTPDASRCTTWMNLRNEELHTGKLAFAGWSTSEWLPDYYRTLRSFARHVDRTLDDLLGPDEASNAEVVIDAADAKDIQEVAKRISQQRTYFFGGLNDGERGTHKEEAKRHAQFRVAHAYGLRRELGKVVPCPVCSSDAALVGELVRASAERIDGDHIVSEVTVQPSEFDCTGCRLKLTLTEMYAASRADTAAKKTDRFGPLTSPFTVVNSTHVEVYFDPKEYYEPDYEPDYSEYMDE